MINLFLPFSILLRLRVEAETLRYSGDSSHEMVGSTFIVKQTLPNELNPRRSCITVGPLAVLFPGRVISVCGCTVLKKNKNQ